jgi:flavorubredoxin
MAKILIIYHTQSGNTEALAGAIAQGAGSVKGIEVILKKASEASLQDLLECDGILIGTPDYFSYMAGAVKDFFDRTCYPSEGKVTGKPCAAFVSHGGGGEAIKSLEKLCKRMKFKKVIEPLSIETEDKHSKGDLEKAEKFGRSFSKAII